jgi:hypothetical protein
MTYGDEYVKGAIQTMVADCENANPFQQDLGIAAENVFQIKADARWMGRTRADITRLFSDYFEPANLAKLLRVEYEDPSATGETQQVSGQSDGEVVLVITFLSIESNTEQQLKLSHDGQGLSGVSGLGLSSMMRGI